MLRTLSLNQNHSCVGNFEFVPKLFLRCECDFEFEPTKITLVMETLGLNQKIPVLRTLNLSQNNTCVENFNVEPN